jgi:hypothetical protein
MLELTLVGLRRLVSAKQGLLAVPTMIRKWNRITPKEADAQIL